MNLETLQPGIINLDLLPSHWGLVACGKKKQPYQKAWQKNPLNKAQISKEIKNERCQSVGVLCGTPSGGLLFVDHDGPSCTALIEQLSGESIENALPTTLVISSGRTGRAQYVYQVPEMFWQYIRTHKVPTGATGEDGKPEQLEFRWDGCQSIVMGAHPSTAGYKWLYDADAITTAPLWMIEQMFDPDADIVSEKSAPVSAGQQRTDNEKPRQDKVSGFPVSKSAKSYKEYSDSDWAREYLAHIPPTEDYDTWLHVGMALHSVSPDLLVDWDDWSKGASNYEDKACETRWRLFKRSGRSLGTLGHLAKINGWVAQVSEKSAQVNASQRGTDKLKAKQGKDFDAQVSKSVDSKEDFESPEDVVTPQEWERFAQTMKTPGSFDPFLWLPEELAKVARSDAARNSVDPMAIWGYLLPAVMSMMGAETKLDMSGWKVPNIIWSLVIAESGMGKSRAKELVVGPIEAMNAQEFENWQARVEDWAAQERAKAKDKSDDNEPNPKPTCRRWAISHSTPEGMVKRLKDQDGHGVLAYRDEFAGWVKGLTQYNPKGNGMEVLLETWDGGTILVDRVNEDDSFLVRSSRLSLVGGIQPGMFAKVFETAEDSQGILGRFMCLLPTEFPYKRYRGMSMLPGLLTRLYTFLDDTEWGTIHPTREADDLFTEIAENFMNQKAPTKNAQPWMRKLAGQTLRLAMAIHAIECFYDRSKHPQTLTADTMARAYHMAEHYKKHFFHMMGIAASDGLEGILAKIQSLACCSGDGLTARDIARGAAGSRIKALAQSEGMRPPAFCLKLFQELADNGWGELKETLAANGRKRISYHAFPDHCSNFTDSLTGIDTTLEHQGLRTVNEPLTSVDQGTDLGHDYTLRDTRNQGVQPSGHENEFTDLDSSKEESNQFIPISHHSSPPHSSNGNGSTNGHHQNGSTPPDYSGLTPENLEEYGFEDF